jgi:hypothetical protein
VCVSVQSERSKQTVLVMCANCGGMGVPFFELREKIWPYVLLLTLFNLMVHPIIGMNIIDLKEKLEMSANSH